jgi:hypothetical protein
MHVYIHIDVYNAHTHTHTHTHTNSHTHTCIYVHRYKDTIRGEPPLQSKRAFFIAYGQNWCDMEREKSAKNSQKSFFLVRLYDKHSRALTLRICVRPRIGSSVTYTRQSRSAQTVWFHRTQCLLMCSHVQRGRR